MYVEKWNVNSRDAEQVGCVRARTRTGHACGAAWSFCSDLRSAYRYIVLSYLCASL